MYLHSLVRAASHTQDEVCDFVTPRPPGVDAGKVLGLVGAKDIVEADRSAAASEDHGYHTLVTKLFPVHSSPKNDVLVGAPPTKFGASAIQRLLAAASAHAGRAPASVRSSVSPQQV